jgi:hypothetical protein
MTRPISVSHPCEPHQHEGQEPVDGQKHGDVVAKEGCHLAETFPVDVLGKDLHMRLHSKLRAGTSLRGLSIVIASLYIGNASAEPPLSVETRRVWSYSHAQSNVPGQEAEIVAHDERTDTLWGGRRGRPRCT